MASGSFVLVLHGHLPWVLHHGRWPHGEHWLYEAALEVYLPLLDVVDRLARDGIEARIAVGLTPVLLEQLAHRSFRTGFAAYLEDRLGRARKDAAATTDGADLPPLARRWEEGFLARRAQFQALEGDLPGAFGAHARAGRIEVLSSLATHAYAPLLLHDASIRAQVRAGLATSQRHLGVRPSGLWLPECAFRPSGPWTPPALHKDERNRSGVDRILEEEGVTHFFVDAHVFRGIRSEGVVDLAGGNRGAWRKVGWEAADESPVRRWRDVLEPHLVSTVGGESRIAAFARHPEVSEQVWSGAMGYPGDGRYLEFHRKNGDEGLRYWRVTRLAADLALKEVYRPEETAAAIRDHAAHFAATVREVLKRYKADSGRHGCLVAPFDAELFGHWWHEGPEFLRETLALLHREEEVDVHTPAGHLSKHPPDKVAWLPEGSWGAGGDHRVWLNEQTNWAWEAEYRAEDRFLGMAWEVGRAGNPRATALARKAARELLLLQASDWAFVVHTRGAVDYGWQRFCGHLERFDRLTTMVWDAMHGRPQSELQRVQELEADVHDECFGDVDLAWWV